MIMNTLIFNTEKKLGKFKILNAVNNGPVHKRYSNDQKRSNFEDFKRARIPYARNHDAAFFAGYGGEHAVDITSIFCNFDADVNDPASYDFACTDEYILATLEAGTETFYRLGQKIEHYIKKYNNFPPKDYHKWAQICEHIIRHYNEGWANGYELNIQYWEIWNEPDLDPDDSDHKKTWGGTKLQFFDLFEVAAKHLKACFPNYKIGGPALAYNEEWCEDFLCEMRKRGVEIDFFSWHIYCNEPILMIEKAERIKAKLINYGYGDVEVILNEWNYVQGWVDEYVYSLECIAGIKGAAFTMSCMSLCQESDCVDMLMYYDARPCVFNGMFDFYTLRPMKGYYPFLWYGGFYDLEHEIRAENKIKDIYSICGCDKDGKLCAVITHYSNNDEKDNEKIKIDFGKTGKYDIYLLDKDHSGELVATTEDLTFDMPVHSCILIKEK